jgi:hypothetical protein
MMDLISTEKDHLWYKDQEWVRKQEMAITGKRSQDKGGKQKVSLQDKSEK